MRRRIETVETVEPRPCSHGLVTFECETAPACMWGQAGYPARPHVSFERSEWADIERARWEHMQRVELPGPRYLWVERADLMDPFGEVWTDA